MAGESSESHQGHLDDVLARYLSDSEAGDPPDRDRLLADHPDLAGELLSFFESHDRLRRLANSTAAAQADPSTQPPNATEAETLHHGSCPEGSGRLGRAFGNYELLEEIARGGMGVVYRARQKDLNRIVALKMILAGRLAGEEDVRRFRAEAEAAANLDHPGIVPIYEVGEHQGQHFFSMRLVHGKSLAAVLAEGPLPVDKAVRYTRRITEAIAYAHDHGVIHRDLKPANVLVDEADQPKVTDFGLAKRLGGDSSLTNTGQILGTPAYIPPEQAAGRVHEVTKAADIYSLGAILYSLLSGSPPFRADSPIDTLVQVLESEPTLPTKMNTGVPRQLELICMRCLEKKPSERYPSARALADDLDRFLEGEPVQARPPNAWQRLRRWGRRQPALAAHLAGIVFTLVTLQVTYVLIGTDFAYHLQHSLLLLSWALCATVLQQFVDRPRWSNKAAAVWAGIDVVLFTAILYLAATPLGPLLIGYSLLVAASGLFFRVRLVVITTAAAALGYILLMVLRPDETGPPQYVVIHLVGLAVLGRIVVSQVRRIRRLDRHFERGRRSGDLPP